MGVCLVACEGAIIQHIRERSAANGVGRIAGQRTVFERAVTRPATNGAGGIARHHTVGHHCGLRFAPQPTATLFTGLIPWIPRPRGTVGQSEPRQSRTVRKIGATYCAVAIGNARYLAALDKSKS